MSDFDNLPILSGEVDRGNAAFYPTKYLGDIDSKSLKGDINKLFTLFQSVCESSSGVVYVGTIKNAIPEYKDEFDAMFNDHCSVYGIEHGIDKLGGHFLSRDPTVQQRANAFVRQLMCNVESMVYGECKCQEDTDVQRDHEILYPCTPSPGRNQSPDRKCPSPRSKIVSDSKDIDSSPAPSFRGLFRSASTPHQNLKSGPKLIFTFEEKSLTTLSFFLESYFKDGVIDPISLNSEDLKTVGELWDYFGDSGVGPYTPLRRSDIEKGLSCLASNFIAADSKCQLLVFSYCQRKLRHAINVVSQRLQETAKLLHLKEGDIVIYVDHYSTRHQVQVCNRMEVGAKAYYTVEFIGSKERQTLLHSELCLDDAPEQLSSQKHQQQPHMPPTSTSVYGNDRASREGGTEEDVVLTLPGTPVPPHFDGPESQVLPPPSLRSMPPLSAARGSPKSLSLYDRLPPLPPTNPESDECQDREFHADMRSDAKTAAITKRRVTRVDDDDDDDDDDGKDEFNNQKKRMVSGARLRQSSTAATATTTVIYPPVATLASRRIGSTCYTVTEVDDKEDDEESDYWVTQRAARVAAYKARIAKEKEEKDQAAADVGKPITSQEKLILQWLREKLGDDYIMPIESLPSPIHEEGYKLWLFVGGEKEYFYFQREDYGVSHLLFLGKEFISEDQVDDCRAMMAARETFRCFFIHLAVGTGIHPFALQACFRHAAADIMSRPEELNAALFGECLRAEPEYKGDPPGLLSRSGNFVDAQALLPIWPTELDQFRVMVCKLDWQGSLEYYSLYEPVNGPKDLNGSWAGKDVIMTNKDGHFTLLRSKDEQFPITRLLATAKKTAEESGGVEPVVYPVEWPPVRYRVHLIGTDEHEVIDKLVEGVLAANPEPTVGDVATTADDTGSAAGTSEPSSVAATAATAAPAAPAAPAAAAVSSSYSRGSSPRTSTAVSKRISQDTFDEAVEENMVTFKMSKADAIKDAVYSFSRLGVDLENIITEEPHTSQSPTAADSTIDLDSLTPQQLNFFSNLYKENIRLEKENDILWHENSQLESEASALKRQVLQYRHYLGALTDQAFLFQAADVGDGDDDWASSTNRSRREEGEVGDNHGTDFDGDDDDDADDGGDADGEGSYRHVGIVDSDDPPPDYSDDDDDDDKGEYTVTSEIGTAILSDGSPAVALDCSHDASGGLYL